jgi:hypothetical protein
VCRPTRVTVQWHMHVMLPTPADCCCAIPPCRNQGAACGCATPAGCLLPGTLFLSFATVWGSASRATNQAKGSAPASLALLHAAEEDASEA